MGKLYPYSTTWVKIIMAILHIYGDSVIFLLFCNHQDNQSESQEVEIGLAIPVFTHKNIKVSMRQQ